MGPFYPPVLHHWLLAFLNVVERVPSTPRTPEGEGRRIGQATGRPWCSGSSSSIRVRCVVISTYWSFLRPDWQPHYRAVSVESAPASTSSDWGLGTGSVASNASAWISTYCFCRQTGICHGPSTGGCTWEATPVPEVTWAQVTLPDIRAQDL